MTMNQTQIMNWKWKAQQSKNKEMWVIMHLPNFP